jgi:hypothetical protein
MDEKHSGLNLKAPASRGGALHLPGRGAFPAVDDHLVVPEVTRDEIIAGRRVVASPAEEPHASQQTDLGYVVRGKVAAGYQVSSDLLTRVSEKSDFASDVCVYKKGIDPATGKRHLEEIAFEVVSTQSGRNVTEKAVEMSRRGVRRIFGIWVKGRRKVCEWSAENGSWRPLDAQSHIEDRCLATPLKVAALLDAAEADNAVAEGLIAKGNPTILKLAAAAESRGIAESILKFLETRGIAISSGQREEILSCTDGERLDRWLRRAAVAASAAEVLKVD